ATPGVTPAAARWGKRKPGRRRPPRLTGRLTVAIAVMSIRCSAPAADPVSDAETFAASTAGPGHTTAFVAWTGPESVLLARPSVHCAATRCTSTGTADPLARS